MIITVGSTKGGVGKSTVAVQLATGLAAEGLGVWLVDGDRQTSSEMAMRVRAETGVEPYIQADACADESKDLAKLVRSRWQDFDHVVIDSGGRDTAKLREAISVSHVLVVPFEPASFGLWALDDIEALVNESNARRKADGVKPIEVMAFLNRADANSKSRENLEALAAAAEKPGWRVLDVSLVSRKAFERASARGITALGGPDQKASAEMQALLAAIFKAN